MCLLRIETEMLQHRSTRQACKTSTILHSPPLILGLYYICIHRYLNGFIWIEHLRQIAKNISWLYCGRREWKKKKKHHSHTSEACVHSESLTQFGMHDRFHRQNPTIWPLYINRGTALNGNEFLHSVRTQDLLTFVNF